ncbi:Siderophore iron transporter ARN1 [Nakaseomyces bracarensis]|uniref:Siderophore iron transporter ARN1 n=1 Tax=Nakaseomyces bracarensis TaxID=273131 RepID=A0ABR4NTE5_9SACH
MNSSSNSNNKRKDTNVEECVYEDKLSFEENELQNDYEGDPEKTNDIQKKSINIVIREAEIMADVYKPWKYQVLLLVATFICSYGYGLDGNIRYIYTGYATSAYAEHSLLSTINVINAVISAASQIIFARLSDVYGRFSLFCVSIVFYAVGSIIQSQAYDVQKFAAGSIFYNTGFVGVMLILILILSDFSSLRWRVFYQFVPSFPAIINTWIAGTVTSKANPLEHWSWDIAMWAFIFPLSCVPLLCVLTHMWWLARKTEDWRELSKEKTFYQEHGLTKSLIELFWKLDVIGVFLMTIALGCILVPLTLAGGTSSKWHNPHIIAPFVLGFVLVPLLGYWEAKYARDPIVPYKLVKDRGVWGAFGVSFTMDFIYYMAADYLYTVMIIAVDESVKSATVISSLTSFVSSVAAPFFGLILVKFNRLKGFLVFGCALWFVSMGLLFHFRGGKESHSGIIGALSLWGIACTIVINPIAVSVQAVTSHEHMATVTALSYTFYRIGAAVGAAVSGAIWTQTLYGEILKRIGDESLATDAYASPYEFIVKYTWDTPQRQALVQAYRYVQKLETLVALVFCVPLLFFSLCLRDARLDDKIGQEIILEGEYVDTDDEDPIYDWIKSQTKKIKRG